MIQYRVVLWPLSHYLANMGREVSEIKCPCCLGGFKIQKCYTFLETLLAGEKIWGDFGSANNVSPEKVKTGHFLEKHLGSLS